MIGADELRELLHYDPDTGIFTWLVKRNQLARAGDVAGSITRQGYRQIKINGKPYIASRLAYLYMIGKWPPDQMDHINRIRDDDRWENLRPATNRENSLNRGMWKTNTSGHKGVTWKETHKKWVAQICVNYKVIHLGIFDTIEEAIAKRKLAEQAKENTIHFAE